MLEIRFNMWGRRPDGEWIRLFGWCRDANSGVARAWRDASRHGVPLLEIVAVPVYEG